MAEAVRPKTKTKVKKKRKEKEHDFIFKEPEAEEQNSEVGPIAKETNLAVEKNTEEKNAGEEMVNCTEQSTNSQLNTELPETLPLDLPPSLTKESDEVKERPLIEKVPTRTEPETLKEQASIQKDTDECSTDRVSIKNENLESSIKHLSIRDGLCTEEVSIKVDEHDHSLEPIYARVPGDEFCGEEFSTKVDERDHSLEPIYARVLGDELCTEEVSTKVDEHEDLLEPIYARVPGDEFCGEEISTNVSEHDHSLEPIYARVSGDEICLEQVSSIANKNNAATEHDSMEIFENNFMGIPAENELSSGDIKFLDSNCVGLAPALEQPDAAEECAAPLLDVDLNGTPTTPLVNEDEAIKVGSPDNLNELAARTLIANTHDGTNSEEQSHLAMVDESMISNTLLRPRWHTSPTGTNEVRGGLNSLPDTYGTSHSIGVRTNMPRDIASGVVEQALTDLNLCDDKLSPELPVFADATSTSEGKTQVPKYYPALQEHWVSTAPNAIQVNESELREVDLDGYISMSGMHRAVAMAEEDQPSEWEPTYATPSTVTEKMASPCVRSGNAAWQVNTARNVQPLSSAQLRSLYYNNELAVNSEYIESFVQQESRRENHEFDEILTNYYRACKKLMNAENVLRSQQESHKKYCKDMWETVQENIVVQGYCKDGAKCVVRHLYEKSEMNHELFEKIGKTLQTVRNSIEDELSLQAYSAQLSRLQVESYIHNLFRTLPILKNIHGEISVQAQGKQSSNVRHQIQKLKDCITVLFSFHRRPIDDHDFVENIRLWTTRLVSVLLRIASFEDHLFILNHVLRCPAGVGTWAANYIQIPTLIHSDDATFVNQSLDHMVTVLATILQPIKGRETFLQYLNITLKERTESTDNAWIMVDSDGEENEDPKNAWQYLRENDVVSILGQVALNELFQQVLMMTPKQDGCCGQSMDSTANYCNFNTGSWIYDVNMSSESVMMKVFAFFTCFIDILSCGLKTFSLSRYRQLNKRIGRMITQIMLYTSDHWLSFRQSNLRLPTAMLERLQVEFDQLFLRAVHCILNAERMGSWQYMTDMPYASVSLETTWKLMWMLHMGQNQLVSPDNLPPLEQCKAELKDPLRKAQLADSLQKMPISEAIYLLTAFSNMVQCRHQSETEFIQTITVEVFEIAYLYDHTKDFCSKVGRELLSAIAQVHPVTISFLLQKLRDARGNIGAMALYLFKELPMYHWLLDNGDLAILRSWLVSTELSSTENLLARTIFNNLNWGLNRENTDLALPLWIHQYVACVLVEAYHNYITSKHLGSVFMEGVKQVALVVRQQQTNEQQFSNWAWDLVFKLHLHNDTLPRPFEVGMMLHMTDLENIPELRKDTFLAPVQQGLKVDNPIAMYVAMTMTKYGHDVAEFITHGIPLLSKLNSLYYTKAVIHIIGHCVPMFYNQAQYLIENQEFLKTLQAVLLADETPMRVAKNLISSDFPGVMTKLFNSMILTQIQATNQDRDSVVVISLWTHLILKIPKWSLDRNCCYILDNLVRSAFRYPEAIRMVETLLSEQYQCLLAEYRSQGMVESFVNWIAAGQNLPSFLEKLSSPEVPWLAYLILTIEGKFEECTLLWPTMQQELLGNPKMTVEQAWKKSAVKLKLKTFPAFPRLNIYRWAQQAVDTPCDHPVLPLIWQRFFVLYLGRLISPGNLPERASNGNRFFEPLSYNSLLKKMKKKLSEVVQHHLDVLQTAREAELQNLESPSGVSETTSSSLSLESLNGNQEMHCHHLRKSLNTELHKTLVSLFESFQYWLDEPRLHEATLYLPALPTQYAPERLNMVFQCEKNPWFDLIDFEMVSYESTLLALLWTEEITVSYHHHYKQNSDTGSDWNVGTATARILNRLKTHNIPLKPPLVHLPQPPVPEVSVAIIEEKPTLMYILNSDLKVLCNHARSFSRRVSKHISLDLDYLDIFPQLYSNEWNQVPVTLECKSSINFTHKCSGSITTTVRVCEKTLNTEVQRKVNDIEEQQKILVQEGLLPPPQKVCVSAVHVENIITTLIKLTRACTDEEKLEQLQNTGCSIFYYLANMVTNETNFYPPTRQFFASCLDILGQEFIQQIPAQCPVLLNFVLDHPDLAGLMSPHFLPNQNPSCFLAMYEKLIVLRSCQIDMAFMLLSKFDVCIWLEKLNLPHPEVVKLIEVLSTAFISCGAEPMARELMLFELFCTHLHKVLNASFHLYLSQVLSMLLKVSSKGRLHVKCWQIFSETCFPYIAECVTPGSFDEDYQLQQMSLTQPSANQLSTFQLAEILELLASFFMEQRLLNKESSTFGLYSKWHRYVPYIASIGAGFLKILASKYPETLYEDQSVQAIDYIWNMIINVFSPWIRPLKGPVQTQLLIPWTAGDHEAATIMVQNFCDAVQYIHTFYKSIVTPTNHTQEILGRLWVFYTSVLATRKIPSYCVTLLNVELALLPWEQLTIDLQVAETMATIRETGNPECFQMVKVIAPHINWQNCLQGFINSHPTTVVSKLTSHLFYLFLQLAGDNKDSFFALTEEVVSMFMTAENLSWNYLDSSSFTQSVNWYLQHCQPKSVLAQRSSLPALELRIIKSASKFNQDSSAYWTPDISKKRVGYVYCIVQLLCQCSYQEDISEEAFSNTILNLLTEIETVEISVPDRYSQHEESVEMMKALFSLLNNCSPEGGISELITSTIYSWLESSVHSILLLPTISAACLALASVANMTQVIEKCIDVYFSPEDISLENGDWTKILSNLTFPELNLSEFLDEAQQQGAYLTLYAYLQHKLPLTVDIKEEQALIWKVLDWSAKGKSCSDNEAKMLLWWHQCFKIMVQQLDSQLCPTMPISELIASFIVVLTPLAEDKDTTGILGAIGLGRRSNLSIKFRLVARALAVFLHTTIHPDLSLRVHPEMSIIFQGPGKQALNSLKALRTSRQYSSLITEINFCCDFVVNPANVFRHSLSLLEHLVRTFYPHKGYWTVLLPPLQQAPSNS